MVRVTRIVVKFVYFLLAGRSDRRPTKTQYEQNKAFATYPSEWDIFSIFKVIYIEIMNI